MRALGLLGCLSAGATLLSAAETPRPSQNAQPIAAVDDDGSSAGEPVPVSPEPIPNGSSEQSLSMGKIVDDLSAPIGGRAVVGGAVAVARSSFGASSSETSATGLGGSGFAPFSSATTGVGDPGQPTTNRNAVANVPLEGFSPRPGSASQLPVGGPTPPGVVGGNIPAGTMAVPVLTFPKVEADPVPLHGGNRPVTVARPVSSGMSDSWTSQVGLVANPSDPTVQATSERGFSLAVPRATFVVSDLNAAVNLSMRSSDGSPPPPWVHFDSETGVISGEPPPGTNAPLDLVVVAYDSRGNEARVRYHIATGEAPVAMAVPVTTSALPATLLAAIESGDPAAIAAAVTALGAEAAAVADQLALWAAAYAESEPGQALTAAMAVNALVRTTPGMLTSSALQATAAVAATPAVRAFGPAATVALAAETLAIASDRSSTGLVARIANSAASVAAAAANVAPAAAAALAAHAVAQMSRAEVMAAAPQMAANVATQAMSVASNEAVQAASPQLAASLTSTVETVMLQLPAAGALTAAPVPALPPPMNVPIMDPNLIVVSPSS